MIIKFMFESIAVKNTANKFHLSENETIELFYNSGLAYLEILRNRVKNIRIFNKVLKPYAKLIAHLSPQQVFETIEYSSLFWGWWVYIMHYKCNEDNYNSLTELHNKLRFTSELIPSEILAMIFYGKKQEPASSKGTAGVSTREAAILEAAEKEIRERVGSRV